MSELETRTRAALQQFDNNMAGLFDRKSFYQGDLYSASSGDPSLNNAQKCFKWSLFTFNVLFLIFGIVLMAVGSYALSSSVAALVGNTLPSGLIVLGVFIMLLALLGGVSAWKESRLFLTCYFIFLLLFTIILFAVGIAVYVYKDKSSYYITQAWSASPPDVKQGFQVLFNCCGLVLYNDTAGNPPCPTDTQDMIYAHVPCLPKMNDAFSSSFESAGACGIAFAVIMLAGMVFVCYLMTGIKRKAEEHNIAKLRTGGIVEDNNNDPNMVTEEYGTDGTMQEHEETNI